MKKSLAVLTASILSIGFIAPANATNTESSASIDAHSFAPTITAKPLPADYWKSAVTKVRKGIGKATKKAHPMEFSYSPSTLKSHATIIKRGATKALKAWGRYINSDIPLTVFVAHPKDRAWFKKKWEEIGVWEDWKGAFERPVNGGGAVVVDKAGVPFMWYMSAERFPPPNGPIDYYMHEVFHFYQSLDVAPGISTAGDSVCWYVEGSATFLGYSMTYESTSRTIAEMTQRRDYKMKRIRPYLTDKSGKLKEGLLKKVFIEGPEDSNDCQHQGPQYGYNFGFFVTELLIYEFGYDKLIDFSLAAKKMEWEQAFLETYGISAEKWADSSLVPAMKQLFKP
jgi:hypothetical protein